MKHLIYIAIQLLVDCIAYQLPVLVNKYLEFSMVNGLVRDGGSNFTLVRQNLWTLLNVWENVAIYPYLYTHRLYIMCKAQSHC